MDEVAPRIWIGELPLCLTENCIQRAHITAVVSCMIDPPLSPSFIRDNNTLNVPVNDTVDAPIYLYFSQAHRFIQEHLERDLNANVLVYCQAGQSRSVTVSNHL